LQAVGVGETRELPTTGLTVFDDAAWSDDGRQIVYEGLTSSNEWNVYTQRIDGGAPVLVKVKGRNSSPTLSPDGTMVALHGRAGEREGIFLYRAGSNQPTEVKGVVASEYPVRFIDGQRALLVADIRSKDVDLTLVDLASGRRRPWKHLSFSVASKRRPLVVTPDLKYYAYNSPRYSSDLYLVENLR
jgi:hypothetical protein